MILWLEDRRDTVALFETALKLRKVPFHMLATMAAVDMYLKDETDKKDLIFVLDIMLHGVHDLSSVGIPNAPTVSGNRAGQVFAERYLRHKDSLYADCPIIFLTERVVEPSLEKEVEQLAQPGGGPVTILRKYVDPEVEKFVGLIEEYGGKSN